jgi:hypothetical protein
MTTLRRSLLLVVCLLAVWSSTHHTQPTFAQDKKQDLKLQQISIYTPDLWALSCFPDGSGNVSWAASPNGLHSTFFKAGTLDFQAMATRIKELSDKEAVGIVMDGTVITSTLSRAGALDFKAKLDPIKELAGEDAMVFVRKGKGISFKANVECYSISFDYGGNHDKDESGQFPVRYGKETGEFLHQVFTAAINEKATKIKGKDFDKVWREKPPAFISR